MSSFFFPPCAVHGAQSLSYSKRSRACVRQGRARRQDSRAQVKAAPRLALCSGSTDPWGQKGVVIGRSHGVAGELHHGRRQGVAHTWWPPAPARPRTRDLLFRPSGHKQSCATAARPVRRIMGLSRGLQFAAGVITSTYADTRVGDANDGMAWAGMQGQRNKTRRKKTVAVFLPVHLPTARDRAHDSYSDTFVFHAWRCSTSTFPRCTM